MDANYKEVANYTYNNKGNLLEAYQPEGLPASNYYDNLGQGVIAIAQNAKENEIFFDSFEDGASSYWYTGHPGGSISPTAAGRD